MTPEDIERRRDAKRFNEGVTMLAVFMNNLAVGAVIAGIVSPLMAGRAVPLFGDAALVFTAMALHLSAGCLAAPSQERGLMMNWSIVAVPLIVGAGAFAYLWLQSRAFDRKHPRPHPPAGD